MGEKVLEIKDVSKDALRAVNAEAEKGDFLVVAGPSGSGKRTLLNLISGIEPLQAGRICVGGTDITEIKDLSKWRASSIGYMLEENNLIPTLNAGENVELPLIAAGVPKKERRDRAMKALDSVGLKEKAGASSSSLSTEQAQRVALARAIAVEPILILAHEPTGRLEKGETDSLISLMSGINKEHGHTFVVATHDDTIRRVASKVLDLAQ